jgi:hypothetical protein
MRRVFLSRARSLEYHFFHSNSGYSSYSVTSMVKFILVITAITVIRPIKNFGGLHPNTRHRAVPTIVSYNASVVKIYSA